MPTFEEIRQEAEWRRCKRDVVYFLTNYWSIRHPERGRILFDLFPAQRETLAVWLDERMSITLKARQIGYSSLAAGLMFWETYFHDDRFDIALSKTEREAMKLLAKVKYGMRFLPAWMKARGPNQIADTAQKVAFDNESMIECLPSTDPARGESAYRIIVDEWAFFTNADEAWSAIEPAADVGGRITALSTANGSGNLFHEMCVAAMARKSTFKFLFFSWRARTDRDDAWYETKKRNMREWQLHQEYPNNPDEAFIKSGRTYFDIDLLDSIETIAPRQGYLSELGHRHSQFMDNADGPLHVWFLPKTGHKYVIGADVAEGLDHGDYSVAQVIDVDDGMVVAKWRGHIDPDLFGSETLWFLGWFYNGALIGPEVNNHGHATMAALNNKGYPNLYYRHSYDERTKKKLRKLGWHTNAKSKPLALDELSAAIRDGVVLLNDDETIGELRTFVQDENGKTHGSPYDDCVLALAIANQMLKHAFMPMEDRDDEPPEFSLKWWEKEALSVDDDDRAWVIGRSSVRVA